jgi:hypothetical protein
MLAFHQGIGLTARIVYMSGQPYVFVVVGTFLRESRKIRRALENLARAQTTSTSAVARRYRSTGGRFRNSGVLDLQHVELHRLRSTKRKGGDLYATAAPLALQKLGEGGL